MKHMKKLIALFLAAVVVMAVLLTGCGSRGGTRSSTTGSYPVTVGGVSVNQPKGVVVLSDSLADVVLALGYEAQLKGKSEACTQEDLSPLQNYSLDDAGAIAGSGADVVLLDTEPTPEQRSALEQNGMKVIVLAPATNRASLTTLYSQVGLLFKGSGVGDLRGEKVANSTLLTLDDIYRSIPERGVTPTACYLYGLNGNAATGDTFAGGLFFYAGLINVFDSGMNNSTGGAAIGNPRYIFCDIGMKPEVMRQYSKLSAVKNGRVYEIDSALMRRQGGSILKAVTEMAGFAYPELLQDASTDDNISNILEDEPVTAQNTETASTEASEAA